MNPVCLFKAGTLLILSATIQSISLYGEDIEESYLSGRYEMSLSIMGGDCEDGRLSIIEGIEKLSADFDSGPSLSLTAAVGRTFKSLPLIIECEMAWRRATCDDEIIRLYSVDGDLDVDLECLSGMFNIYATLPMDRLGAAKWTGYAGVGVGYAMNTVEASIALDPTRVSGSLSEWSFCHQLIIGISRPIGRQWAVFLNFRYLNPGSIEDGLVRINLPSTRSVGLGIALKI